MRDVDKRAKCELTMLTATLDVTLLRSEHLLEWIRQWWHAVGASTEDGLFAAIVRVCQCWQDKCTTFNLFDLSDAKDTISRGSTSVPIHAVEKLSG